MDRRHFTLAAFAALFTTWAIAADIDYGKPGTPVKLVVGYQPYYTQAWTGVVMRGKKFYEKYLPKGSNVEFQVGLQGAIIVNNMLAGKQNIGYMGDMPSINATSHPEVADLRIVSTLGLGYDQCNAFLVRNDAPKFSSGVEALKWLNGKRVAVPKGSCTDRFAQTVFKEHNVKPAEYLNQNIEVITSGFRAGKLDAAVMWEPTTARLELEGLARRVATGFDFKQIDGGFLVMRLDLIKQRPDVVKAWLNAELDAQLYLADIKNAAEITKMAKEQTTGFSEKSLWYSLYGSYGRPKDVRLMLHFAITPEARDLLVRGSQFLHSIQSIKYPQIRAEAIMPQFAEEVLNERNVKVPLGSINPLADSAFTGSK
jgi:sulfonate transport system substrate-binding protein